MKYYNHEIYFVIVTKLKDKYYKPSTASSSHSELRTTYEKGSVNQSNFWYQPSLFANPLLIKILLKWII